MIISLMGFMGSGKSTFGRQLALHCNVEFIDLDDYIVEKEGKSVNEIFATEGESVFRILESSYLKTIVQNKDHCILSLGGGTPCSEENWKVLNQTKSIYLKRTHHFLSKILINKKAKRPLIKDLTEDQIKELITEKLEKRAPYYERADLVFHGYGSKRSLFKRLVQKVDELS